MRPGPCIRRAARHGAVLVLVTFLAGALAPPALAQSVPLVNLEVPSSSTGGGDLALRLALPPIAVGPRYPEGAPIVVLVPGGHGPGGLTGGEAYAGVGFVAVTFLFPGGVQGPFQSDGAYDYRGAGCQLALRDVLAYAGGLLPDALGRTIGDVVPFPVLVDQVGTIGLSNGGPISMATLATHGAELHFVAYYVGWENPTGAQTVDVELGSRGYDCDPELDGDGNGIPVDDGKNPYLTTYEAASVGAEWNRLAFDADYEWVVTDPGLQHPPVPYQGALFFDGNGNGQLDFAPGDLTCLDLDGDGRLDVGDDYLFRPVASYETGSLRLHHSVEVTTEAWSGGLFGGSWPPEVADPAQCDAYWSLRDATRFYADLALACPDLHVLLAFGAADHVQAADEHIHVQQAYDGLRGGGLWCRLNPDEIYYRLVDPSPPSSPTDTDADESVAWPDMVDYAEPWGLDSRIAAQAAVMEMADRRRSGIWLANLSGPVVATAETTPGRPDLVRVRPAPAGPSAIIEIATMRSPAVLRLFDSAGRCRGEAAVAATPVALPLRRLTGEGTIAPGVYWLEVTGRDQRTRARLVVSG